MTPSHFILIVFFFIFNREQEERAVKGERAEILLCCLRGAECTSAAIVYSFLSRGGGNGQAEDFSCAAFRMEMRSNEVNTINSVPLSL